MFWNYVIGGVVGALVGGVAAALDGGDITDIVISSGGCAAPCREMMYSEVLRI